MRLLILSRNSTLYSTARLVLAARAKKVEVDVIDPLELQVMVGSGASGLRRGGERLPRYDAVIPRIGTSITHYGLAVVRQLERQGTVVLNGAAAIALARDKVQTLDLLAHHGVSVPRTICTRSLAGLDRALELVGGCPTIVKLHHGTQGVGTMIAETPQSLFALVETLWAMGQEVVMQQFVAESGGRDVRALVVGGRVVAAMRRVAPEGEFRSNIHRGAIGGAIRLPARFRNCALKAAALCDLEVAGVDMLESATGPMVLELNSSPGLEGIEHATAVDVAARIIEHALARAEAARKKRPRARNGAAQRC